MLVEVLALFVLCLLGWHQWTHRRILRLARSLPPVPGYTAIPILGHAHYILWRGFIGMSNLLVDRIKTVASVSEAPYFCYWFGPHPILFFYGSEDVQTVMNNTSTIEKGKEMDILKFALGNGLLTARGKYWKVLRRHINPLFHTGNLNQLIPVINESGRDLTLNLSRHVGTGHVDVQHRVNDAVLVTSCKLLFGKEFKVDVDSEPYRKMSRALDIASELFGFRTWKIWLRPEIVFNMWHRKLIQDMTSSIDNFFQIPLEEFALRIREHNTEELLNDKNNSKEGVKQGIIHHESQLTLVDMYDKFNQTVGDITKENVKDEIVTMMIASSETTKVNVSSCLIALSLHPQIQEKLYAELVSVVGDADTEISLEHLQNLPYLEQVVKESLRWTVIVPFITRRVHKDIKLNSLIVPAGSTVGVCLTAVHYDPSHYPNPDRFDPDNFLPERVAARPKYAFVPFSGGPRGCIGSTYSIMVAKILIAHVVRNFKLSSDVDIYSLNNKAGLVFSYLEGYKVQLRQR